MVASSSCVNPAASRSPFNCAPNDPARRTLKTRDLTSLTVQELYECWYGECRWSLGSAACKMGPSASWRGTRRLVWSAQ